MSIIAVVVVVVVDVHVARVEVQVVRVVRVVRVERTRPVVPVRTCVVERRAVAVARSGKVNLFGSHLERCKAELSLQIIKIVRYEPQGIT